MNKKKFEVKFEALKNELEGKYIKAINLDNRIELEFDVKNSIFDSSYDIGFRNFSYYVVLETDENDNYDNEDFAWIHIDYEIASEGPSEFDTELLIKEIYL